MDENQEYINNVFNIPDDSQNQDELTDSEYLEKYSDIGDEEYFNLFGSRKRKGKAKAGGNKWNKREANKFAGKVKGSVETARTKLDAIISVNADEQVKKEDRKVKFLKIQAESKVNKTELEAQWTSFQNAQKGGWDNSANRETARKAYNKIIHIKTIAIRDWKLRHNYITTRDVDKVSQFMKATNPAVIALKATALLSLRLNFLNLATIFKLASIRNKDEYEAKIKYKFKRMSGNRTKWDKAVDKGYKKKPVFAKKMNIDWDNVKFDGFNINGDKKTLKIPGNIIAAAPTTATGMGALIGVTPIERAANAATWGIWGSSIAVFFDAINLMNIPLGKNESQPEADNNPPTPEEIAAEKAQAELDAKEGEYWIPKVPNWLTVTISTILVLGTIGGILYGNGVFDKKPK